VTVRSRNFIVDPCYKLEFSYEEERERRERKKKK
jgi:hypothetical protein